jgi:cyanophycinase-like exopeptidase
MKALLLFLILPIFGFPQGYTSYFTGNPTNITTNTEFGVCLMGGATENDNAMKWLMGKANGGDIVVLRTTGSNGYNNYLYSQLGLTVNSVETLVITSAAGAISPYVLNKVANAEMIWFAGGDQSTYVNYFKNNALEDALNNHINVKQAPIGGTSAGMAILGNRYFSAFNGSITSAQALANPYNTNVTLGINDFLNVPYLNNVITDTHFDNPDRKGRLMVFLARLLNETISNFNFGIASNEYTAVCIDNLGNTKVFGDYPNYPEYAYFVVPSCYAGNYPENLQSGQNLTWNYGGNAALVYKVAGLPDGSQSFNLTNLFYQGNGNGGDWKRWSVNNGQFLEQNATSYSGCLLNNSNFNLADAVIYPNPFQDFINLNDFLGYDLEMYSALGVRILNIQNLNQPILNTNYLKSGVYFLNLSNLKNNKTFKIIKQ